MALFEMGRCFRAVDPLSDGSSKLIAIDEETNHQIMHGRRFGKANRATHETLDPGPQIDMFALDFLRVLLAHMMLLWIDVSFVSPPSIGVKSCDTKWLAYGLSRQKDPILTLSRDICQDAPTVMINGVP